MKTIEELKKENLPSCTAEEIFYIKEDATEEETSKGKKSLLVINQYLDKKFLPFSENCVRCNAELLNAKGDGAIKDGEKFGEAQCAVCAYPSRYYHHLNDFGIIQNIVLQYHPDTL